MPEWMRALATCSVGALALLVTSCAATRPVDQLSEDAVVLDAPLVPQDSMYACGLASISALCEYYQASLPPEQASALAALAQDEKGLTGAQVRDALRRRGFEVYLFEGTLDHADTGLLHHIDLGRPLLVMTSPGGDVRHYVLFLGYDEPRNHVCLLDPLRGRVLVPRELFDRTWERCQRFTLLALPGSPAASESPSPTATESHS
jgi:ABC-type bacteriocin/lantibiotic exporter with double-glycine peptidase domain